MELLPANSGFKDSAATGIAGDVKVGYGYAATSHALLWSGPHNDLTDLTPAWAMDAALYATNGSQHAGVVDPVSGGLHAVVWLGSSAEDAIDLHD